MRYIFAMFLLYVVNLVTDPFWKYWCILFSCNWNLKSLLKLESEGNHWKVLYIMFFLGCLVGRVACFKLYRLWMRLLIVSFYTALDHFSVACFPSLSSLSRDNCFYIGQIIKKTIFQVNSYTLYQLVYSETMLHI